MADIKLWGGRFSSDQDPIFDHFNRSLPFDQELMEADIEGSLAYARALERAGVLAAAERQRLEKGLKAVLIAHRRDPAGIGKSGAEDVHSYVEQVLARRVGNLALKLHTGRSRNDQVATDLRIYLRGRAQNIDEKLRALLLSIADRADTFRDAILPGYTHLQPAQPVLFSHYLLSYGEMFLRDRLRLKENLHGNSVCPLGSGAIAGTVYRIDRTRLARDLGFTDASHNSMDAVSDRDFVLEFLFFSSMVMTHLSRLAEDLILFNSAEFGFIVLPDSLTSGSSLMPQKKNPDALELIRGKTGRVNGHLIALLTVMKGLPMTYNKDLQEDKECLFDAVRTVSICLHMMQKIIDAMEINRERMRKSALVGYLNATELADYLVSKNMPFRKAHHLAGRIVRRAIELQYTLEDLPLEEYRKFSPLLDEGLYRALSLESAIGRRMEKGGTSSRAVRGAIRLLRKRIREQ